MAVCLSVTEGAVMCTSGHPSVKKAPLGGGQSSVSRSARAQPSLSAVEAVGRPQLGQGQPSAEPGICLFPTGPSMSASSQPEWNSQGSTPFGWPDVSAAHVPTSRTPEIPRTHRTGCKP